MGKKSEIVLKYPAIDLKKKKSSSIFCKTLKPAAKKAKLSQRFLGQFRIFCGRFNFAYLVLEEDFRIFQENCIFWRIELGRSFPGFQLPVGQNQPLHICVTINFPQMTIQLTYSAPIYPHCT